MSVLLSVEQQAQRCPGSGQVMVYPNRCPVCRKDFTATIRFGQNGTPRHKAAGL